jgi:hypothetical protein
MEYNGVMHLCQIGRDLHIFGAFLAPWDFKVSIQIIRQKTVRSSQYLFDIIQYYLLLGVAIRVTYTGIFLERSDEGSVAGLRDLRFLLDSSYHTVLNQVKGS